MQDLSLPKAAYTSVLSCFTLQLPWPPPHAAAVVRPGSRLLGVLRGQMSRRCSPSSELLGASCAHVKEPEGGCPARASGEG